jgi:hypothetical protein
LRICLMPATISLNGAQRRVVALDRFTSSAGLAVDPIAH